MEKEKTVGVDGGNTNMEKMLKKNGCQIPEHILTVSLSKEKNIGINQLVKNVDGTQQLMFIRTGRSHCI